MSQQAPLHGIFTPNIVLLDQAGEINEPELRRYIDWLIERGVHGLYPNGSTGEFTRFTAAERRRIVAIVADQTAGRVPILAGAAEANVQETIAACEYYHSLGIRAVAIVAPFYYKLGPESVYVYFKEIGDNTPIDITLYNIPMFASPIDVPTIRRLVEACPRIIGIKDSTGNVHNMMQMIEAVRPIRPDFCFLNGWEAVMLPMMLIGCNGGTHASSGVVPEMTRELYEMCVSGRLEAARLLQSRLNRLFDLMLSAPEFPEGFREGVRLRGFEVGVGRQPLSDVQQAEMKTLGQELQKLIAEEKFSA